MLASAEAHFKSQSLQPLPRPRWTYQSRWGSSTRTNSSGCSQIETKRRSEKGYVTPPTPFGLYSLQGAHSHCPTGGAFIVFNNGAVFTLTHKRLLQPKPVHVPNADGVVGGGGGEVPVGLGELGAEQALENVPVVRVQLVQRLEVGRHLRGITRRLVSPFPAF